MTLLMREPPCNPIRSPSLRYASGQPILSIVTSSLNKQIGEAMGSPVSPVIANLFMEHVEEEAIRSCPYHVRFWRRNVDDTCFLQRSSVEGVLNHLNSISPSINFTVEQEEDEEDAHRQIPLFQV